MIDKYVSRRMLAACLLGLGAALGCGEDGSWGEGWERRTDEVVYGTDNRKEYLEVPINQKRWADATAILTNNAALTCGATSCSVVLGIPFRTDTSVTPNRTVIGLCPGEKYGPPTQLFGQGTMVNSLCSAFLVGSDLMVAAGHCFVGRNGTLAQAQTACADMWAVFDYKADSAGNAPASFSPSSLRECQTVLGVSYVGSDDWVVFKLSSPVTGRSPLPLRRSGKVSKKSPLAAVGYPDSFPVKIAVGGTAVDNSAAASFTATTDTFHGNSGSPIIHRDTETVEGVLQDGANDYVFDYGVASAPLGCLRPKVCSQTSGCPAPGLPFEIVTRSRGPAALVPSLSPRLFNSKVQPPTNGTYVVVSGDYDGDGYFDIFWYRAGSASDTLSWSNGVSQTFLDQPFPVNGTYRPVSGDFDGDGNWDIYFYGPGSSLDIISWGNGDRTFNDVPDNSNGDYQVFSGDFDGDGAMDILWYAPGSAQDFISWFVPGQRRYVDQAFSVNTSYRPVVGDFNGNGRAEILWYAPGSTGDQVWYFSAGRALTTVNVSIGGDYQPIAGDYDGDGFTDIVWYVPGTTADGITWGRSNGTFPIDPFRVSGTYITSPADFNGDGATDILWYQPGSGEDIIDWGRIK